MMTPSQLKEYEFKTAGRNAYKADDVDDFFAEVAANYTKMFHENGELVRRVGLLADRLEKFKKEEEEIKSAVVSAQRAADIIVRDAKNSVADAESEAQAVLAAAKSEAELIKSDAEKQALADADLLLSMTRDKAEEIIKKAKDEAADILANANDTAKEQMGAATRTMTSESLLYDMLKKEVSEFKTSILNQYKTHIELISKLPELAVEEAKKQEADAVVEAENNANEDANEDVSEENNEREEFSGEDIYSSSPDYDEDEDENDENASNYIEPLNIFDTEEASQEPNIFEVNSVDADDYVDDAEDAQNEITEEVIYNYEEEKEEFQANERKEALRYFVNENKDDVMEVDEEMLTQDGELVVKTDLPASIFDDVDSLEFVDDFDGMEKREESSAFSFDDVQTNNAIKKRVYNKVTVDPAYLDFLAAESDEEEEDSLPNVSYDEEISLENNESDDTQGDIAPQRRGFFKRK